MITISDIHIAANRSAGTTPATAAALKQYTLNNLENFLTTVNEDLLIAGDMFDGFNITNSELLATYKILSKWLEKGYKLVSLRGNHDAANDSSKLSSFNLLGELLADNPNSRFLSEPGWAFDGTYCVPHVLNQDRFDAELVKVPECTYCVLHCNVSNHFAVNSDHSLNITKEQLEALPAKVVYVAHEHNTRKFGKAFIGGVQWPTAVADVLDGKDKFAYRLHPSGQIEPLKTWSATDYAEIQWDAQTPTEASFVRLVGRCEPERATDAANAVAQYRRTSKAFIVSNAVVVSENQALGDLAAESLSELQSFDVMGALREFLSKEEFAVLENLK